jgi:Ca2+/Na+ antiporter
MLFYLLYYAYMKKIIKKNKEVTKQATDQAIGYILGAFGLVAGLAWNDAVQSLIREVFPLSVNSVWAKFVYAVFVTLIVVAVSLYLRRILARKDNT